ncbi:MAG: hypothetical protein JXR96_05980 [Deltaproteobacteria bacterium]|nr:hypothetical protein [Deltaproteobacteria bacterium]
MQRTLLALAIALTVACAGSGIEPESDGGEDAARGWDGDADRDEGDPRADDGEPLDADAGDDGSDARPDASDADPRPCPGPEAYIGDDWPGVLEIPPGKCCLAPSVEGRALEEMRETQAVMRIAAGSYAVPIEEGSYAMRLPACIQRFEPPPFFELGDAGTATVQRYGESVYLSLWQEVYDHLGAAWRLRVDMSGEGSRVQLDSAYILGPAERNHFMEVNTFPWYERWQHRVVFEGGELCSDFFAAWGSTPSSGLLVRASGSLDGVAFEQSDYWKLVNNHQHHFFGADWAVLFDAPIGGACGLRIDGGNPIGRMEMADLEVHTVDCELAPIELRPESHQEALPFELDASPCPAWLP